MKRTTKILVCKYGLLAQLVKQKVLYKMEINGDTGRVSIREEDSLLHFSSNSQKDFTSTKFYKYFNYAEGLKDGLEYEL